MTCSGCREALSALLDGEDRPGERAEVEIHLERCAACRRYADRAARVTRLARTEPVTPLPELVPVVSRAVAVRRAARLAARPRWCAVLRVVLALVGVGQIGLAVRDLYPQQGAQPNPWSGPGLTQLAHESSAWNLALAVGFLCVAARPSRTRALLPLVAAFVAALGAVSLVDATHGRLVGTRMLSHGVVAVGLVVLLALALLARVPGGRTPDALGGLHGFRGALGSPGPARPGGPAASWPGGGQDLTAGTPRRAA